MDANIFKSIVIIIKYKWAPTLILALFLVILIVYMGFPGSSVDKESAC